MLPSPHGQQFLPRVVLCFYFLQPRILFKNQWKYLLWSYQAAASLPEHILHEKHTQSQWAKWGAEHLENIPAGAGKGVPREPGVTWFWQGCKGSHGRSSLIEEVPPPALLGDHRAARVFFLACCRHNFPAEDLLKEGWEAKDSKITTWGSGGISQGAPLSGTKECNPKKADLCQHYPKMGPFWSLSKSRNGHFMPTPRVYCKPNVKYCVNCKQKAREINIWQVKLWTWVLLSGTDNWEIWPEQISTFNSRFNLDKFRHIKFFSI